MKQRSSRTDRNRITKRRPAAFFRCRAFFTASSFWEYFLSYAKRFCIFQFYNAENLLMDSNYTAKGYYSYCLRKGLVLQPMYYIRNF